MMKFLGNSIITFDTHGKPSIPKGTRDLVPKEMVRRIGFFYNQKSV